MIKLVFLVFLALSLSEGDSEGPSADRLQELAEELSGLVWQKWSNFSLSIYLEAKQNLSSEAVEEVNGSVIAEEVATNLSESLSRFRHFLNETAAFAESLYSNRRNQNCCSSVCQYGTDYSEDLCSMACNRSSIRYISSGRGFGIGMETGRNGTRQCVMGSWGHQTCTPPDDEEEAAVHIPRDVHEEDPDVLCFVQWTEDLSRHFTSTRSSLPYSDLTQYIGTDSRLMRFYPPFDWSALSQCNRCPLSLQDTFELGRRPWYTNTVTGDKFIVVLLDVSGSMAGFQSLLARTTISQLLRALTSNDYFLIVQVGEGERTKSVGCFSEKTRATPENVLVASHDIMLLPDTNNVGRAHFSQPLQDYLRLLGNSTECHRVLIIFSDGERETPLPIDLVRANKDLEVQIFSFLVGGGPDDANMKIVACENRGRMGRIREYFDIIPAVLLITDSLALPSSRNIHYTLYRGIRESYELAMGLPLWESSTNETFGIVGFDIPYQQLLTDALQKYRIGASGYAFVVDNNGELVSHPAISEQFIQSLSDDSLLSLDMDYFELPLNSTQWAELREIILTGGHGQSSIATWALVERQKVRYVLRNTTYSFAPISDTPYMVVVVTPTDLWVSDSESQMSEVIFSPLGGRGQCESGRSHQCEGLQIVEGKQRSSLSHLTVLLSGSICGNDSSVVLLRSLEVEGHPVGVVSHTLFPEEIEELLTKVAEETVLEDEEIFLLDESANIIASYPYRQRGWFPAMYPEEVLERSYEMGRMLGFEPRTREGGRSGVCESGEGGEEGEWACEDSGCGTVKLFMREIKVFHLRDEEEGHHGNVSCSDRNLVYVIMRVPNTSLAIMTLSGSCLRDNNTGCYEHPIRYRCLPCQCGSSSLEEKFRAARTDSHTSCPTPSMTSFCSAGQRPRPSLATNILISALISTWFHHH